MKTPPEPEPPTSAAVATKEDAFFLTFWVSGPVVPRNRWFRSRRRSSGGDLPPWLWKHLQRRPGRPLV